MTIDLKWGLPLYASSGVIFIIRWSAFLSGVVLGPEGRDVAVFLAVVAGLVGAGAMFVMHDAGIRWNVTIGGRKND